MAQKTNRHASLIGRLFLLGSRGKAIHIAATGAALFWIFSVAGQVASTLGDSDAEPYEYFGTALARGDFNGDRYEDLAIGVPFEEITDGTAPGSRFPQAGAVEVIYGTASGLTPANRQFWRPGAGNLEGAPRAYQFFGLALAAGDFNRDGYADLAIGAPGNYTMPGSVYVLHGSATGLWAPATVRQNWHQGLRGLGDAAESGDAFGSALATGDFDRDGYADLAIGAPEEDIGDIRHAGAVNVIYGSALGLSLTATEARKSFWHQVPCLVRLCADAVGDGPETGDNFGHSLATGDFNNDGVDDLAIGVPNESVGVIQRAGAVNVIYGSAAGLTAAMSEFWHQNSPGILDDAERDDRFGWSLSAGDFNNDSGADLAIGAPGESFIIAGVNLPDAGAVNVIYGSATGLTASGNQFWRDGLERAWDAPEWYDHFGHSLAAGDFDSDGADDLAIGIPDKNVGDVWGAGAVRVLHGRAGTGLSIENAQYWSQNTPDVESACEQADFFGYSLAAGRFNGARYSSLAIGVAGEELFSAATGAMPYAGAVSVIYGSDRSESLARGLNATTPVPDQIWTQNILRGNLP